MKLKSISFENYKAFKEKQTLEIKPITILIGKNSSGKSAIAKLFTLLENSLSRNIQEPLLLNNYGVELGAEFLDLVYGKTPSSPIKFSLNYENEEKQTKTLSVSIVQTNNKPFCEIYEYKYGDSNSFIEYQRETDSFVDEKGNSIPLTLKDFKGFLLGLEQINPSRSKITDLIKINSNLVDLITDLNIYVDYIGPFRVLPQRQFYHSGQTNYIKTGIKGENAYPALAISKSLQGDELHEAIGTWYENNYDGWRLEVNDKNKPYFEILVSKNVDGKDLKINLVDVGQGMHQVLPLIVSAANQYPNGIIVLEQPELHLHPAAHANLAELFAISAKSEKKSPYTNEIARQSFIIETHSENILLRLRKLVVENDFGFTKDDVIIYWVDNAENGGQQITPITIDEEGTLSNFPDGVFNENLKEIWEMDSAIERKNNSKL